MAIPTKLCTTLRRLAVKCLRLRRYILSIELCTYCYMPSTQLRRFLLFSQMPVQPFFDVAEEGDDAQGNGEVEGGGGEEWYERFVGAGVEGVGDAGDVEQGRGTGYRRAVQHEDDFVAVGGQCAPCRAGEDDAEANLVAAHAECFGRLDFAFRRGFYRAAHDFAGVGGGVEDEGEHHPRPRLAQQRPQREFAHAGDAADDETDAVVEDVELYQHRCAAKEVAECHYRQFPPNGAARGKQHAAGDGDSEADGEREADQPQGLPEAAEPERQVVGDDVAPVVGVHLLSFDVVADGVAATQPPEDGDGEGGEQQEPGGHCAVEPEAGEEVFFLCAARGGVGDADDVLQADDGDERGVFHQYQPVVAE